VINYRVILIGLVYWISRNKSLFEKC